jgi:hypothetical protein
VSGFSPASLSSRAGPTGLLSSLIPYFVTFHLEATNRGPFIIFSPTTPARVFCAPPLMPVPFRSPLGFPTPLFSYHYALFALCEKISIFAPLCFHALTHSSKNHHPGNSNVFNHLHTLLPKHRGWDPPLFSRNPKFPKARRGNEHGDRPRAVLPLLCILGASSMVSVLSPLSFVCLWKGTMYRAATNCRDYGMLLRLCMT